MNRSNSAVERDPDDPGHATLSPSPVGLFSSSSVGLLLLLLTGFVLRIILAHRNVYPSYDGTFYLNTARDIVAFGELYRSGFPPGYPLLCVPVLFNLDWQLPQTPLIAGQVVNVLAGTALGLLSYRLARREHADMVSLTVAAVVLFLPLALQLSASDLSELSFACFLVGGWLLFTRNRLLLAGVCWGFGYLIRPELLLVIALLAASQLLRRRFAIWRLLAGAAMMVLPYVLFLSIDSGALRVSAKSAFLERALQSHPGTSFLAFYAQNSIQLVRLALDNFGAVVVLLSLLGLVVGRRGWGKQRRGLVDQGDGWGDRRRGWAICMSPLLILPAFDFRMDARYLMPFLPFILLAGTDGARWLVGKMRSPGARRALQAALIGAALISVLIAGYGQRDRLRGNFEYFPAMRDAGLWLRERVENDTIIAGRKPYVSFWAWCQYKRVPDAPTLEKLVAWAEAEECSFMVVHAGVALGMAPALTPLLGGVPSHLQDRLALVRVFEVPGQPNETTYIYRMLAEKS